MKVERIVLGALLGSMSPGCQASYLDHGLVFESHELVTGAAPSQVVLTGSFLGGPVMDLAVVGEERSGERHVRIHALENGAWVSRVEAPVRREVLFVDVLRMGEQDRLITYERGSVSAFDPHSISFDALVEIAVSFEARDGDGVPHVDVTRDLNDDGYDDLLLPALDGFWISLQANDRSFGTPVRFGPPEPFRDATAFDGEQTYGEVGINAQTAPWYLSRIHQLDYDGDGRSDLAFWNEDHFDVHRQNARGSFDSVPATLEADVPFDSDGVYTHIFGYEDESEFSLFFGFREKSERTVLYALRDFDGDEVVDLVTHSLEGRSLVRQRSRLEVHRGRRTDAGLCFEPDASTALAPRGAQPFRYSWPELVDLDGDGRDDVMLASVRMGFSKMIRAVVGNSITLELEFYRVEDGSCAEEPDARRRVEPAIDVFGCRGPFFPTVLTGDVNGDGLPDLLVGQGWEELRVYVGVPGPELFARRPQKVEMSLTADENDARLVDLDLDGKQDLLVHHRSKTEPHRIVLLMAR